MRAASVENSKHRFMRFQGAKVPKGEAWSVPLWLLLLGQWRQWGWFRASCPRISGWHIGDKLWPMLVHGSVLRYVHRNHKKAHSRLSHNSWTLKKKKNHCDRVYSHATSRRNCTLRDKMAATPQHDVSVCCMENKKKRKMNTGFYATNLSRFSDKINEFSWTGQTVVRTWRGT